LFIGDDQWAKSVNELEREKGISHGSIVGLAQYLIFEKSGLL